MKRCPKCHQTYKDDSLNFCLTDGEALVSSAASSNSPITDVYSEPKGKPKRRKRPLLFAIVGIAILGLLAGSYLYFFGSQAISSKSETNRNAISVKPQPTPTTQLTPIVTQTPEEVGTAPAAPPPAASPGASPEASNATPTPSQQNTKTKVDSQFFTFELKQCRLSGASVACDLLITNNDRDRRLTIHSNSTIFDQEGNQYRAGKMQLANNENSYGVSSYMIAGVTTKSRVMFDAVSPTTTKLTLLHLNFSVEGSPDFNIEYRNVPLK